MFFLSAKVSKEAGNEVFSLKMGDLGTIQDVSFTLGLVILAREWNSFPTLPPLASYCLEFLEVYQRLGSFFCCWLQFCYRCDADRNVNNVGMQTKCIQCVRMYCTHSVLEMSCSLKSGAKATTMTRTTPGKRFIFYQRNLRLPRSVRYANSSKRLS